MGNRLPLPNATHVVTGRGDDQCGLATLAKCLGTHYDAEPGQCRKKNRAPSSSRRLHDRLPRVHLRVSSLGNRSLRVSRLFMEVSLFFQDYPKTAARSSGNRISNDHARPSEGPRDPRLSRAGEERASFRCRGPHTRRLRVNEHSPRFFPLHGDAPMSLPGERCRPVFNGPGSASALPSVS
jgi:hypothetical protein